MQGESNTWKLVAGYLVVRDKIKVNSGYARNLPGFFSSTFGDGNQQPLRCLLVPKTPPTAFKMRDDS